MPVGPDKYLKLHPELEPPPWLLITLAVLVVIVPLTITNINAPRGEALLEACAIDKQLADYSNKARYTADYTIQKPFLEKQYIVLTVRDKIKHETIRLQCITPSRGGSQVWYPIFY